MQEFDDFPADVQKAAAGFCRNAGRPPHRPKIFVNLPVKDLNRSVAFFTKLGYKFNPQFTDENATCMIIGDDIFAMLLVEPFFKTFTPKTSPTRSPAPKRSQALSAASREAVTASSTRPSPPGPDGTWSPRTTASCTVGLRRPRRPHLGILLDGSVVYSKVVYGLQQTSSTSCQE